MIKLKFLNKFRVSVLLLSVLLFTGFVQSGSAQSNYTVVFDETRLQKSSDGYGYEGQISEAAWYGGSHFAENLTENGFGVSKISDRPITYDKLKGYNVLIMLSNSDYYSSSEIDAIKEFVKNGGGLLFATNSGEYYINTIVKRFGISFAGNGIIADANDHLGTGKEFQNIPRISNITSHNITKGVSSFYLTVPTYIKDTGSSNVLAYSNSDAWFDKYLGDSQNNEKGRDEQSGPFPVLAEMSYGNGRIYVGTTSDLIYRIIGTIVVALFLFAGVIYKIRKDEKRGKETTIKPIETWKLTALIIGYIISWFWCFISVLAGLAFLYPEDPNSYDPYLGYMYLLPFTPSFLITTMILYNLIIYKKLHRKYLYFNVSLCAFGVLYSAIFGDLDGIFIGITVIFPIFIPNFMSVRFIRNYGGELVIKGKELKILPKPLSRTLPVELKSLYTEAEYLGEGGFAWVFRATRKDGKKVAVKIPKSFDEQTGKLFVREVSHWSDLEHENIVNLGDFNIFPTPYLEMELCDRCLEYGKPNIEKAVSIIFDIARGLRYAHERKIIHGDIKPSNILIKDGKAKISDWGLSKVKSEASVSLSGMTPQYAAPEQISSKFGKADERTDIYQLGVVFYELATGKMMFEGKKASEIYDLILHDYPRPPSEINLDSKCIEHIIMKCIRKRKEERYQSLDEFIKEIEGYTKSETTLIKEKKEAQETIEFLSKKIFCDECGNELEEDTVFCTKCGYKVR